MFNNGDKNGLKPTIGDFNKEFKSIINKALKLNNTTVSVTDNNNTSENIIDAKATNSVNGLETSTFTICCRIRPIESYNVNDINTSINDNFECIYQGNSINVDTVIKGIDRSEECVVFNPKLAFNGKPKIEKEIFLFDKTFGREACNSDIYETCKPLIARVVLGQIGVIFAFGQTSSGKTYTMNGLMDSLINDLYDDKGAQHHITFSYLEMLGDTCNDCLVNNDNEDTKTVSTVLSDVEESIEETDDISTANYANTSTTDKHVRIGELLDGRVVIRNLSEHCVTSSESFKKLLAIAKSKRTTESTERNSGSSRSHGIGIIRITSLQFSSSEITTGPTAGVLYIVDLAGSERMADSKNHSDARMVETKAINLSLMSLKECIRARTYASKPGCADIHVPFRRSKLTLLMKDCFDISCARLCNTIVLSHVSPIARDVKHSVDTIKYAAPLRVAIQAVNLELEKDYRDPALWNHDEMMTWLQTHYNMEELKASNVLDIGSILLPPNCNGLYICQMPELTLYSMVISAFNNDNNMSNDTSAAMLIARTIYSSLWMLICDAKTRKRRPNGTIITEEDEEKERQKLQEETAAKAALWKLREAQLKTGY